MKKTITLVLCSFILASCFKEDTGIGTVRAFEEGYQNYLNRYNFNTCENYNGEYVDLGLSVKWAKYNLGSEIEEGYGNYYAWGETESKGLINSLACRYDWNNYLFYDADGNCLQYGKEVDNTRELYSYHDAANVHLGGSWRMPTSKEFQELLDNCNVEPAAVNGFNGCRFTSKIEGYTDKSIFLPFGGTLYKDRRSGANESCCYWSSVRDSTSNTIAYCLYICQNEQFMTSCGRVEGLNIRPVLGERDYLPVSSIRTSESSLEMIPGDSASLSIEILPENASYRDVFWMSSDPKIASVDQKGVILAVSEGSATITAIADGGKKATCNVTVYIPAQVKITAVDLGLTVKWGDCNLGAYRPEVSGGYYQWAGIIDVSSDGYNLDWSLCPYHTGSDYWSRWSKYVQAGNTLLWSGSGDADNKTELDAGDDAAYAALGGEWRTPTKYEWKELMEKCTWTWTTLPNDYKGYRITSNVDGYTDKSIFLPVSGYRRDVKCYNSEEGYYWTSSLYTEKYNYDDKGERNFWAHEFYFSSDMIDSPLSAARARYFGLAVRPVCGGKATVFASDVVLNPSSLTLEDGQTTWVVATLLPSNATFTQIKWSSSSSKVALVSDEGLVTAVGPGTATICATAEGVAKGECKVTVTPKTAPDGAVALGLSVFWATCNVKASKPEEYGGYYQWAGVEDVSNSGICVDLNNCPYHVGTSETSGWTKYIPTGISYWSGSGSPDNKLILDPEDDVAHKELGGKWRIPTDAEWTELIENCSWSWVANYNGTGVSGIIVTSKKGGYTDNSIFLPAAGFRYGFGTTDIGSAGDYWSSSVYDSQAYEAKANDFNPGHFRMTHYNRYRGLSIRPVSE